MAGRVDTTRPAHAGRLGYRPGLDGLRAIGIVTVLVFHVGALAREKTLGGGFLGVQVFFVISGFLITALLVEEHERNSRISLGKFYARRALRLFPALLAVIAAAVIYASFAPRNQLHETAREALGDLLLGQLVPRVGRREPHDPSPHLVPVDRGAVLPRLAARAHRRVLAHAVAVTARALAPAARPRGRCGDRPRGRQPRPPAVVPTPVLRDGHARRRAADRLHARPALGPRPAAPARGRAHVARDPGRRRTRPAHVVRDRAGRSLYVYGLLACSLASAVLLGNVVTGRPATLVRPWSSPRPSSSGRSPTASTSGTTSSSGSSATTRGAGAR